MTDGNYPACEACKTYSNEKSPRCSEQDSDCLTKDRAIIHLLMNIRESVE